jgi:hypothetical protein
MPASAPPQHSQSLAHRRAATDIICAQRAGNSVGRAAPDGPLIMVCGNPFSLVRGVHRNGLRSRERRFESCRGH